MDPRLAWNTYVYNLQQTMASRGETMTYEDAVRQAVASGITAPGGVSPQEIGDTLYNLYAQYGPAPAVKFYGDAPTQSEDYTSDYTATGPTEADISAYNARVNENYQLALNKAQRDREDQLRAFGDTSEDLLKQEKGLGVSKDAGLQGNSAYFSAVSPDAYQSQMGNYNQKVLDAYNEGLGTINRNKERVGQAKTRYEQDYADYLRGLELNRQDSLQTYGSGGNFNNFTASDAARVGALDQVGVNPAGMSAGAGIPTIADAMNRYGYTSLADKNVPYSDPLLKYLNN